MICADFDNDGWLDLFVANDMTPNQLWINQRDGTFTDQALARGVAYNGEGVVEASMGADARDIDGDDDLDPFITHLAGQTNTLYVQDRGFFEDQTHRLELTSSCPFTGFGSAIVDFDNDGLQDVYVSNGRVAMSTRRSYADPYAEPNQLFVGLPDRTYLEVQTGGGTLTSRGAAFGDYDNDGDVDIFVVNRDARASVLQNRVGDKSNWIAFWVLGRAGSPAIGARVEVSIGDRNCVRDVRTAYSYCSSNDPRVYFGLGAASRAGGVLVTWVDGTIEDFGDFSANRIVELRRN